PGQRDPGRPTGRCQVSIEQSGHRLTGQLGKADAFRTPGERSPAIGFIHLQMLADQPEGRPSIYEAARAIEPIPVNVPGQSST
ncbi:MULTISPECIES: hypothetical protein, partial [unclassified Streptomyces]|uniref:hypothetical protein n=1 Tax=unclassified Streptomyces TaxID=2593676 RepID=UPI001EF07354